MPHCLAAKKIKTWSAWFHYAPKPITVAEQREPVLTLEHLAVGYGRRVVLPDVNLTLRRGSFTGLLGANGSGKSTLIKTVLEIIPPLSGRMEFASIDGHQPTLGYMPQRESLDPIYPLSSFEIVLMAACSRVGPGWFINRGEKDF